MTLLNENVEKSIKLLNADWEDSNKYRNCPYYNSKEQISIELCLK